MAGPHTSPHHIYDTLQVSFAYSGKDEDCLYRHLELSVDCDSRIALVGPNGAGESSGNCIPVPFKHIVLVLSYVKWYFCIG